MLWGGYSGPALEGLRDLLADPVTGPGPAASAALALARWHAVAGEHDTALDLVREMRRHKPRAARDPNQFLREALLLCLLGQGPEARVLLDAGRCPADTRHRSGCCGRTRGTRRPARGISRSRRSRWCWRRSTPRSGSGPRAAGQTRCGPAALARQPRLRRSPARPGRAEGQRHRARLMTRRRRFRRRSRSLAAQTHENIEVLVVDDASADGTADVVTDFAKPIPASG